MQWEENERADSESHRTELDMRTGVSAAPGVANGHVLLWGKLGMLHVTKVVFAFHLVLVDVEEVVFGQLEGDSKKGVQWVQYFGVEQLKYDSMWEKRRHESRKMTHPGELLNLFNVVLNELRVLVFEVPVELCTIMPSWVLVKPDITRVKHTRDVVYLYTIPDTCLCVETELIGESMVYV